MRTSPWIISPEKRGEESKSLSCHHRTSTEMRLFRRQIWRRFIFQRFLFRIFLVHMLCQFLTIKQTPNIQGESLQARLCMYCAGRCHAGTQKLCMNLRTGLTLPRFSWDAGCPSHDAIVANDGFPFGIPKIRILVVTGILGGEGATPNL